MPDFAPTCRLVYILYSVVVKGLRPAFLIRRALCLHPICTDKVLAKEVARELHGEIGKIYKKTFADGEIMVKSSSDVKDKDVVIVQSTSKNVNEELFSQITSRFNMFLRRKFLKNEEPARGLCIFDKTKLENKYQNWSKIYQSLGNRWNQKLNNFAELPLFLDSTMSRSIQLADLIAFALFRNYEYNDDTYFSIIKDCFDQDKNQVHGLYVLEKK